MHMQTLLWKCETSCDVDIILTWMYMSLERAEEDCKRQLYENVNLSCKHTPTVLSFLSPPQTVALSSWLPVCPTPLQPGSWSMLSSSRGFERWRKRTGRSGCSSANRRAPLSSRPMVTMATSSGEPLRTQDQRTGTTQRRRRTTTRSVLDRPASRSVRSGQETQQQLICVKCSTECYRTIGDNNVAAHAPSHSPHHSSSYKLIDETKPREVDSD